jgi:hypothetical protein
MWFVFLAAVLVSCSGRPGREETRELRRVVLPAGEVHDGWYFAAGDQVVIEGTVNGDVYAAGGTVTVDGTINGDLLLAGGNVSVGGTVTDDIRGGGGSVILSGKTGKNVSAAGGSVTVTKGAEIGGGLLVAAGALQHGGTILKDAMIASGDGVLTGTVAGNARYAGGRLQVFPGAVVGGDLDVLVERAEDAVIADGAVKGRVSVSVGEERPEPGILGMTPFRLWVKVLWALSLLATALVAALLLPGRLAGTAVNIVRRPGRSVLWGVIGLLALPILSFLLLITLLGAPLGLFVLTVTLWFLYLSQLALGAAVGHLVLGTDGKTGWSLFLAVALGILITQALTFVPYLGTVVVIAGLVFGLGAILMQFRNDDKKTEHQTG